MKDTPNQERPLLLLDIDGALSPMIEPGELTAQAFYWPTRDNAVDPHLTQWLERLGEEFDLVWATSWEDEANEIFGPALGLEQLEVIHFTHGVMDDTAKLACVREFVGERSFAWIDDVLYEDAYWFARNHGRAMLVRTKSRVGLTVEHVDALVEFARSLKRDTSE